MNRKNRFLFFLLAVLLLLPVFALSVFAEDTSDADVSMPDVSDTEPSEPESFIQANPPDTVDLRNMTYSEKQTFYLALFSEDGDTIYDYVKNMTYENRLQVYDDTLDYTKEMSYRDQMKVWNAVFNGDYYIEDLNTRRDQSNIQDVVDDVNGWERYMGDGTRNVIESIYRILFPFGMLVLVVCWAAGVCSAGCSLNLDPQNRNSIIRAILQLLIGLAYLAYAPQVANLLVTVSAGLCNTIQNSISLPQDTPYGGIALSLISEVLKMVFLLNTARIALLQCIAPLFAGAAAGGEQSKRIAINFAKEYLSCCLVPPITLIFFLLCTVGLGSESVGFIGAIILAFNMFGIGRKVTDKLMN